MRLRGVVALGLLTLATLTLSARPAAPLVEGVALRYVRAGKEKDQFVLESLIRESPAGKGVKYVSLTDRGSEKMTLTIRYDAKRRVLDAEAVRQVGKEKQTAAVVFSGDEVTLTRQG